MANFDVKLKSNTKISFVVHNLTVMSEDSLAVKNWQSLGISTYFDPDSTAHTTVFLEALTVEDVDNLIDGLSKVKEEFQRCIDKSKSDVIKHNLFVQSIKHKKNDFNK